MQTQIQNLKKLQASFVILQLKAKNYHWNVEGFDFFETHETLDKFYDDTTEQLDALAEKLVMFDLPALGSFKDSLELSLIKEDETKTYKSKYIFENLSKDLEVILEFISEFTNVDFRIQPLLDEIVIYAHTWAWKFKKSTK
ncbi:DNA starvation/stationary phase protection protein [Mycoplasmopsis ciconiae]|uniref:DNA starvation/stationary phase protection protein n=1 Tax=Mycoplasmopsis ciconiae TaxID=561067 RepID=A0ABU7MLE8_9BACT|nr:DNA starvation/stationary phase protection protein [Mycoplasmopsis ciconiae]